MNKAYKQYFDLIFGSTLLTLGIYLFVTPNGINFGGVIGLAQIIEIFCVGSLQSAVMQTLLA